MTFAGAQTSQAIVLLITPISVAMLLLGAGALVLIAYLVAEGI